MAKDDYHVIVYQILSYLYQRLKNGEDVDITMIGHDSPLFSINKRYWSYVIYNMCKYHLIDGVSFVELDGLSVPYPAELYDCMITPEGIEYLCDNSFSEKAKSFLKDIKEITPFNLKHPNRMLFPCQK